MNCLLLQLQDEENMNLKEVIRAQVMKELNHLEVICHDMASLLRGLGIIVGNSVNPSLEEVSYSCTYKVVH